MHFFTTFEVLFETLKGDPALVGEGGDHLLCFYRFFVSKWQCLGLVPVPLREGGLYCVVKNLNLTLKRCEPTTGVPAVN